MARPDSVITVNVKLAVDDTTAETCLRLVEAYVNSNPVQIVCDRKPNGEEVFRYEPIG